MPKPNNLLTAIDLGTHRCCCVIAQITGPESLEVIGIGSRRTDGIRKGVIVNLEALVASIRGAIDQAESEANATIDTVIASVPAAQAKSFTSRGGVTIAGRDRVVTRKDLAKVEEMVRAVQIPPGQSILHVVPQEFTLDGQEGIQDPVAMTGSRLEGSFHVVTIPQQTAQHVVTALNAAHVDKVESLVYPLLASSEAVLTREEKDNGVFLIDCGAGTTDLALFERGALWFTGSYPVAGDLISNDISIGLRTPVPDAESLKRAHARAVPGPDDDIVLEVATVGGGAPRLVAQSLLTQVVAPRVMEIFELARQIMDRFKLHHRARAGAVLVGGTANLEGIVEVAEEVLGMPVRIGLPSGVPSRSGEIDAPSFAGPVGLLAWEMRVGRRERLRLRDEKSPLTGIREGLGRVSHWFGQMF